jgi:hypothetical protein
LAGSSKPKSVKFERASGNTLLWSGKIKLGQDKTGLTADKKAALKGTPI